MSWVEGLKKCAPGESKKGTPGHAGAVPARSTSSRLALASRERLALMNETRRWGEVGQQKPVLEVAGRKVSGPQ